MGGIVFSMALCRCRQAQIGDFAEQAEDVKLAWDLPESGVKSACRI